MGLNLSSDQIAKELDLDHSEALAMTTTLRRGIVARRPEPALSGEVECDEGYVVAGHKGNPEAVRREGRAGRRRRLQGERGRSTLPKAKPPSCVLLTQGAQ